MRVLITGVTGLIGSHLAEFLVGQPGVEVFGLKRWRSPTANLAALEGRITLLEGDVEDPYSVFAALERAAPDRVFHLAAQSYPSESWTAPVATMNTNVNGTIHVLEGVRQRAPNAQVLIACSSAEYGLIKPDEVPIAESRPLRPISPYGVSKVAQELLGLQYHLSFGMRVYLARFFNQVGTRQGDRCSIQTFARQIAEIEAHGGSGALDHGNLSPYRDFLDVKDCVRAIWALLDRGKPGVPYNVCSGRARSMREILDQLVALSPAEVNPRVDPARLRPVDEPVLEGDRRRLSADTGWEPRVPLAQTLAEVLDYWRRDVRDRLAPGGECRDLPSKSAVAH